MGGLDQDRELGQGRGGTGMGTGTWGDEGIDTDMGGAGPRQGQGTAAQGWEDTRIRPRARGTRTETRTWWSQDGDTGEQHGDGDVGRTSTGTRGTGIRTGTQWDRDSDVGDRTGTWGHWDWERDKGHGWGWARGTGLRARRDVGRSRTGTRDTEGTSSRTGSPHRRALPSLLPQMPVTPHPSAGGSQRPPWGGGRTGDMRLLAPPLLAARRGAIQLTSLG